MHLFSQCSDDEWPLLTATALFEVPLNQPRALEFLQLCGRTTAIGNPYNAKLLKELITDLCRRHLLRQEIGLGFVLREDLRMAVLLRAQQRGELKTWITHVRDFLKRNGEYQHWKSYDATFYRREMLFSLLLGRTDETLLWREKFYSVATHTLPVPGADFFNDEEGLALFAQLKEIDQGMLLTDVFTHANWHLNDCRRAYDYACSQIEQHAGSWPQLMGLLAWQALLRGDFDRLEQLKTRLPPQVQAEFLIVFAVLQKRMAAATGVVQTYAEVQKTATGKRKLFLPETLGLLATIALLAKNDSASLKLAKAQVDEGVKQKHAYSYFVLQPLVHHLASGVVLPISHFSVRPQHDIDAVFEAVAAYWQDAPPHPKLQAKLLAMRDVMQGYGYQWVEAELDVLLARQFAVEARGVGWHAQHQIVPLLDLFEREASWKRALTALSQLKPAAEAVSTVAEQRLAWLLEFQFQELKAEPREQKRSVKGSWSKGRPVALRRLAQEQDSLPYLLEQDRQIASCVRKTHDSYYGGSEFELQIEKALPHLIAHPAVYWADAPDVRIDVVKGDIALQLKEDGDQISLQLDPYIGGDTALVWKKETTTRLAVYVSSPEIRQISGILGRGISVPGNAKEQLIDVIAAIAPHLPIHSDLPELNAQIASVAADLTVYAHLLPLQEGLRLQLLVRPLAEGGWYAPGQGAAHVLGERAGLPLQANRDLPLERARLEQVLQACPSLSVAESSQQEWQLLHPEQCLELLAELKALPPELLQLVWPEGERFRLRGSRSLANLSLSIKKQGEWFVAGGEITLDDGRVLALRELLQMANAARGRFLRLGDDDYLVLTDSFRQRLSELQALGEVGPDGIRINALAAPALAALAAEVGQLEADAGWRAQVERLDAMAAFVPQLPSTLQAELRDYQLAGYQWLARLAQWGVGACLADDMGLGKTVQTLALLLQRAPNGPALVVAPISVALNWQSEVTRFAPTLRVRPYHLNRSLAELGPFDLVIASYGMLQSDAEAFAAQHWHSVVLDEAQVIKNSATKRSQAAMALQADFKMIASGTPVENHLGELWNLFRFINPGLLGSKERFAERFSTPIERGDKDARLHLKKLLQPFILRRTKTQVLTELPARTEITLQVELSAEERHLYEALRQEALDTIANLGGEAGASLKVLAEITRLRRFCCHPQLVLKQATIAGSKLAVFAETLTELLDNRHKALVFSQFVDHLAIVRAYLDEQGISYQYLDGSTAPLERKRRVDAFQAGEGDVFLISLKAGGTGLNLTAADYVIHLDPWWNPAVEDQASDRAHRMGQLRPVTIYRLVTQNTIEEKILALHADKRDLANSLLDGGDASARLDSAALLRLLKESV
ncbi:MULTISPECIES: DEAD/DEAH box helicase [unclassified Undibacterium]|nr:MULTISPECIES: DEAD/DEAH box helicase [unclassified Undibacterium]MEB0216066.1 DEAD/DEAH box helicase [Undibacterium sp. 5I2]WPX42212.1 DEAD/DEAH box helicase [Undibacterium sp. CCC3.4]